jgi:hypothetical protein
MCRNTDYRKRTAMLSSVKNIFILALIIVLAGACAVIRPPEEKKAPFPEGPAVPGALSDEDLFLLGTSYLGNNELRPDYFNARVAFDKLVKTYPGSRRRQTAEQFIRLIDEIQKFKKSGSADDYGPPNAQLLKENARLKNDLERLKELEIESEKRYKKLR